MELTLLSRNEEQDLLEMRMERKLSFFVSHGLDMPIAPATDRSGRPRQAVFCGALQSLSGLWPHQD